MKKIILLFLLVSSSAFGQQFIPFFDDVVGNNLLPNLLSFWRFEETSGNAFDSSGNSRTLTTNGVVNSGTGIVANDRTYTVGGNAFFSRASETAMNFSSSTACTITAWGKFTPKALAPNDMTVISRGDWRGLHFSWWLMLDHGTPDDSMNFYYSTDGNWNSLQLASFPFVGGISSDWYFIALRWSGTTLSITAADAGVDVILPADVSVSFSGAFFEDGSNTLTVGAVASGESLHDMDGDLDEIGIYNRRLSDCELDKLYIAKAGSFTYTSFDSNSCGP